MDKLLAATFRRTDAIVNRASLLAQGGQLTTSALPVDTWDRWAFDLGIREHLERANQLAGFLRLVDDVPPGAKLTDEQANHAARLLFGFRG